MKAINFLLFLILGYMSILDIAGIFNKTSVDAVKNVTINKPKKIGEAMTDGKQKMLTAIVIGATGAVGSDLVKQLRDDDSFKHVEVFARRNIYFDHPKFHVHVIDFEHSETWKNKVKGDVLFSCLGTTIKQVGSEEAQWKIDHDYQFEFAKAAHENGVKKYILV